MELNRRSLIGTLAGAAGLVAFRGDAFARLARATRSAGSRAPAELAQDETFWAELSTRTARS